MPLKENFNLHKITNIFSIHTEGSIGFKILYLRVQIKIRKQKKTS